MTSITASLLSPLLPEGHVPRLTWYGPGGARTELSTASLANWSAKVAGLLTDELGGRPGDRVYVALPAGWQTAPVLLGAWWAGLVITTDDDPDAIAAFVVDGAEPAAGLSDEVFVVSGHPLGAPSQTVAAHQRDFTTAVLPQADRFGPPGAVGPDSPALIGTAGSFTVAELLDRAAAMAELIGSGARLLSAAPWTLPTPAVDVVLGPLAAAGSLVQVDPSLPSGEWREDGRVASLAESEHITHTIGADVAGLPTVHL